MTARAFLIQTGFEGDTMAEFQTVCRVGDLADGEGTTVAVGQKLIAILRDKGQFFALDDVCPHMGASLGGGYVEDGVVTCPWHAWRFRLADGIWADNPRGKLGVGCYPDEVTAHDLLLAATRNMQRNKHARKLSPGPASVVSIDAYR